MRNSVRLFVCTGLVSACLSACKDSDLFDKDAYVEQVKAAFPVKDIDPDQDWSTIGTTRTSVTVRMRQQGNYTVKVFAQMPASNRETEQLAYGEVANGQTFTSAVSYRLSSPIVYVAVVDQKGFMTVYPKSVDGDDTAVEVGDAVTVRQQSPRRRIVSDTQFPAAPADDSFPTAIPTDARSANDYGSDVGSGRHYANYTVPTGTPNVNIYSGDVNLYFGPGNYTFGNGNSFYVGAKTRVYLLSGANVTFDNWFDNSQSGASICVCDGATLTFKNRAGFGIKLYNRGTVNVQTLDVYTGGTFYNEGTVTVAQTAKVSNWGSECAIVNAGTMTAANLGVEGSGAFLNLGDMTVTGTTTLNSNNCTWQNDGAFTTTVLDCTAGSTNIINNCKLAVTELFKLHNGDSEDKGFRVDGGGSVVTKDFYLNVAYVHLGDGALFKVTGTATMDCSKENYGIYGVGMDATKPAVFQAARVVKGNNSQCNYVTYGGNLWVATDSHFDNGKCGQYNLFNVKGDNVRFAIGQNDASASIGTTACSPGYNQNPAPVTPPQPTTMSMTYCYEDNFPVPGDYDFNDVVMGLRMEKRPRLGGAQRDTLVLTVDVRAVGASKPIAAALRLKDVRAASVDGSFGLSAEPGRRLFSFYDIDRYNTLLQKGGDDGRSFLTALDGQDVVIPLYNDAHYAINGGEKEGGDTKRRFYNTMAEPNEKGETIAADLLPGNVYTVYFKDADAFSSFSLDKVDLFIIEESNGACYEVHTHAFKQDEVVHRWRNGSMAYTDNFPWGIGVPGEFKYPVEWTPIGSCPISNVIGGAYQTKGHSFSEWAKDHTQATDWYNYPKADMVY